MSIKKEFYLIIFDESKIHDLSKIIVDKSDYAYQSSSHYLFEVNLSNATVTSDDVTYFQLIADDEATIDNRLKKIMEELDKFDTFYSIKNCETGEVYSIITTVGAVDIKFDNLKTIPKGTYDKIDGLKHLITENGYTKGYTPQFRILEGNSIENIETQPETIYMFSDSSEKMSKLQKFLSEKILEINPDFILEFRTFVE